MMALVYDQSDLSISRVKGWRFGYKKALEHSLWGQQNSYMSYKKIVQAGAGGSIGAPVLKALVDSGQFDVTVLTRKSSNYKPPYNSITVVPVDYTNHAELVEALRGNDALVVTLGDFTSSERNHHALTDAAIKAGLKCIIPSTFASYVSPPFFVVHCVHNGILRDLSNPPGSEEETFRPHLNNMAYIRSKQAEIGHIFITNGCFFEWGLKTGILGLDIPNAKCTIYGDGMRPFNATTYDSVGRTVVSVLSTPSTFLNKDIRVHDFWITQWDLKALFEEETGKTYTVEHVDPLKLKADCEAAIAQGELNHHTFMGVIAGVVFGKHTCSWGVSDDTPLVGLPAKDIKEELKKFLEAM